MNSTVGEEIANSVTHGIGVALSIAGLVVLVVRAALHATAWHVTSCAIYGATLILLYMNSTIYHALTAPRAKRVFQVLDHASIYLLIAGTYTPFTLVTLRGAWGWSLLGVIWTLAIAGVVLQTVFIGRRPALSTALYVAMGWVMVVALGPLVRALGWHGFAWLLAGGLAYTLGVVLFASRRRYMHAGWHLFVLAGSACHYWAVYRYVVG